MHMWTVVTHQNPDLDACMAVWLLTRFVLPTKSYELRFLPVGEGLRSLQGCDPQFTIVVDTGGGEFDHHDSEEYACAASLIFRKHHLAGEALERMVQYALEVDHGRILQSNVGSFDLVNIIEGLNRLNPDNPESVVQSVMSSLDGVHSSLVDMVAAEQELKEGYRFKCIWGDGIGIVTSNKKTRYLAHRQGFVVFVFVDPVEGFRGFAAPGLSNVDFHSVYLRIKEIEPNSDWFLHSSRQLLLCGSRKSPGKILSSLSLEQLINLVRT